MGLETNSREKLKLPLTAGRAMSGFRIIWQISGSQNPNLKTKSGLGGRVRLAGFCADISKCKRM